MNSVWVKFIRIAPTTLYKAPLCYGNYNVKCNYSGITAKCAVEHECIIGQKPEEFKCKVYPEHSENNTS